MESLLLRTVASERCQMFAAIVRHECSFLCGLFRNCVQLIKLYLQRFKDHVSF